MLNLLVVIRLVSRSRVLPFFCDFLFGFVPERLQTLLYVSERANARTDFSASRSRSRRMVAITRNANKVLTMLPLQLYNNRYDTI